MKHLFIIVTVGLIIVSCVGCATIGFRLDGDGLHFEIGTSFPEIPIIDYEKVIE